MLPEIIVQTSKGRQTQPLYGKNAMAARMRRFREEAGCIVWGARAGSDKIRNYMQGLMPHQCIADNSTRDFRDLYPHEVMAIRQQNEGRFAEVRACDVITIHTLITISGLVTVQSTTTSGRLGKRR